VHYTKSRPSSNFKAKDQRSRSPGTIKRKSAAFCSGAVLVGAVLPQFYAGGKISVRCLVLACGCFITNLQYIIFSRVPGSDGMNELIKYIVNDSRIYNFGDSTENQNDEKA